jgi:hypothetical protein
MVKPVGVKNGEEFEEKGSNGAGQKNALSY